MKSKFLQTVFVLFIINVIQISCKKPDYPFACDLLGNFPTAVQIPQLTNLNIQYDFIVSNDSNYQSWYGEQYYILTGDSLPKINFSSSILVGRDLQNICDNAEINTSVETDYSWRYTIYICVEQPKKCDNKNNKTYWWLIPKGTGPYPYISFVIQNSNVVQ